MKDTDDASLAQVVERVTHDLRNPISAVSIAAALLLERDLPEFDRRTVSRVASSADRAGRLLRDLQDFAILRSGATVSMRRVPMDARAAATDVVRAMAPVLSRRALTMESTGNTEGTWDRERFEQVLGALLTCASTLGGEGAVVATRVTGGEKAVEVQVHGDGVFGREASEALFDPAAGGLGLWVARRGVQAHGGELDVHSVEGKGTTITARWPR